MVALVAVHTACNFFVDYQGHGMGARMERDIRQELFEHYEKLAFRFYDEHKTGELMSRLTNDTFWLTELYHHGPEDLIISLLKFVRRIYHPAADQRPADPGDIPVFAAHRGVCVVFQQADERGAADKPGSGRRHQRPGGRYVGRHPGGRFFYQRGNREPEVRRGEQPVPGEQKGRLPERGLPGCGNEGVYAADHRGRRGPGRRGHRARVAERGRPGDLLAVRRHSHRPDAAAGQLHAAVPGGDDRLPACHGNAGGPAGNPGYGRCSRAGAGGRAGGAAQCELPLPAGLRPRAARTSTSSCKPASMWRWWARRGPARRRCVR